MPGGIAQGGRLARGHSRTGSTSEPWWVKTLLTLVALGFLALFLVVPLAAVFQQAFEKGWGAYIEAIKEPNSISAIQLTLLTAAIAVPLNLVFGLAASWCVAKFNFVG